MLITKTKGINDAGKTVHYYFNYSDKPVTLNYGYKTGQELLSDKIISNSDLMLEPWGIRIIEENK